MTEPLLDITLGGALDESVRDELAEPSATLLSVKNCREPKRGAKCKRYGFVALTLNRLSGARSAGYAMFAFRDQVCVSDGHQVDAYSTALTSNITKGRLPEPLVRRFPAPYPGFTPTHLDIAYASGYYVVASVGLRNGSLSYDLHVSVIDATTYTVVRTDLLELSMNGPINARLGVVGTTVMVLHHRGANEINAHTLSLASAASINTGWSAAATLASDWSETSSDSFDLASLEDRFALVYTNTSGGASRLSVRTFNTSMTLLESATASTTSVSPDCVAVAGSNADTLWLAWSEASGVNAGVRVRGLTGNSLASVKATTATVLTNVATNRIGLVVTGTGTGIVVGTQDALTAPSDAMDLQVRPFQTLAGAVAATGTLETWYHALLTSRPWSVDGRQYCAIVPTRAGANLQKCHFVVDLARESTGASPLRVVGNISARQSILTGGVAHYALVSATKIALVNMTQRSYLSRDTGAAVEVVELDYAASGRWQAVSIHESVALSGGVVSTFDGHRVDEVGFLVHPEAITPTLITGTASITATNVKYTAVYEKTDNAGNVTWSAPGIVSAAVSPVAQNVNLSVPTLHVTNHHEGYSGITQGINPVRIAVFRSSANGAAPWYRVTTVNNDPGAASVTFVDTVNDLSSSAQIYTPPGGPSAQAGAEQVHQCPPAFITHCLYNDMLVGLADDGFTTWFSAYHIQGEGLWFNDVFQFPITDGGNTTAYAAMDGTLFILKRRSIFAVVGTAPSGNGMQGGFGDPRKLSVDTGCIEPRSVATTSIGVFFQSDRGIELLTRNQSVEPVGEPVRDTLASFPVITSAVVDDGNALLIFTLAASETSGQVSATGTRLVFDLRQKKWLTKDLVTNQAGTANAAAQAAAMVYSGGAYRYAWLGTDGRVYVEDRTTHLDPGSAWVTQEIETGWFRVGSLHGEQQIEKVLLLAEQHTGHDLTISIAHDYASAYTESQTFTAAQIGALTRQWLDRVLTKSIGQAVRVKLSDATPSSGSVGTGKGATWVAITPVGEKRMGAKRTSGAQRGG